MSRVDILQQRADALRVERDRLNDLAKQHIRRRDAHNQAVLMIARAAHGHLGDREALNKLVAEHTKARDELQRRAPAEADMLHGRIRAMALEANQAHTAMKDDYGRLEALRTAADHEQYMFVIAKMQGDAVHKMYMETVAQVKALRRNPDEVPPSTHSEETLLEVIVTSSPFGRMTSVEPRCTIDVTGRPIGMGDDELALEFTIHHPPDDLAEVVRHEMNRQALSMSWDQDGDVVQVAMEVSLDKIPDGGHRAILTLFALLPNATFHVAGGLASTRLHPADVKKVKAAMPEMAQLGAMMRPAPLLPA